MRGRRLPGHALLPPDGYEPYRCRCGWQGDWPLSEDYAGGWTRAEARNIYGSHLQDEWMKSVPEPAMREEIER